VDAVVNFLDGRDEALNERLLEELQGAALRLDFEKASRLRKDIRSVQSIVEEQTRLRDAEELHNLLLVLPSSDPDSREVLLVVRGRLWAQFRATRMPEIEGKTIVIDTCDDAVIFETPVEMHAGAGEGIADLAARLSRSLERARTSPPVMRDHASIDETSILNRFLFRNAGHPALIPIARSDDGVLLGDPADLAWKALSVTDDMLQTLDVKKTVDDALEDAEPASGVPDAFESDASSPNEVL
jgi:excinuclease UvrABC nuclease subunit